MPTTMSGIYSVIHTIETRVCRRDWKRTREVTSTAPIVYTAYTYLHQGFCKCDSVYSPERESQSSRTRDIMYSWETVILTLLPAGQFLMGMATL
jgi:hypothetical protein